MGYSTMQTTRSAPANWKASTTRSKSSREKPTAFTTSGTLRSRSFRLFQATKMDLNHGYDTESGAVRAIDGCLSAAFRYLGIGSDPRQHLVPRVMEMAVL